MLKAILFDFDYTLGDSTEGIVESINYGMEKLGYPKQPTDLICKTIGLSLGDCFYYFQPKGSKQEAEQFSLYYMEKADEVMVDHTALYKGVEEILRDLKKRGYQIGIVTTKRQRMIQNIFRKFHAEEWLDLIIGGDNVAEKKPSPEGVLLALEKLGCQKSEVLYVGDSLVDARTAESANVDFGAVLTGTTEKEEFKDYPYVVMGKDITEIYHYILQLSI